MRTIPGAHCKNVNNIYSLGGLEVITWLQAAPRLSLCHWIRWGGGQPAALLLKTPHNGSFWVYIVFLSGARKKKFFKSQSVYLSRKRFKLHKRRTSAHTHVTSCFQGPEPPHHTSAALSEGFLRLPEMLLCNRPRAQEIKSKLLKQTNKRQIFILRSNKGPPLYRSVVNAARRSVLQEGKLCRATAGALRVHTFAPTAEFYSTPQLLSHIMQMLLFILFFSNTCAVLILLPFLTQTRAAS